MQMHDLTRSHLAVTAIVLHKGLLADLRRGLPCGNGIRGFPSLTPQQIAKGKRSTLFPHASFARALSERETKPRLNA